MTKLPQNFNLIPTDRLISLAEAEGLYLGSKDPHSYIRYLTKLGLLESPQRRSVDSSTKTVGHYNISSLNRLKEIDQKISKGWSLSQIARENTIAQDKTPSPVPNQVTHLDNHQEIRLWGVGLNRSQGLMLVVSTILLFVLGLLDQKLHSGSQPLGLNDLSSIISTNSGSLPPVAKNGSTNLVVLSYQTDPSNKSTSDGSIAGATLTTTGNTSFSRLVIPATDIKSTGNTIWVGQGTSLTDLIESGQIKTSGYSILSQATSGQTALLGGSSSATIHSSQIGPNSKVFVMFLGNYSPATRYWISNQITGSQFSLQLDSATSADVKFNWWIVN